MPLDPGIVAAFAQRLPLVEDLRIRARKAERNKLLVMMGLTLGFWVVAIAVVFGTGWVLAEFVTDNPLVISACCLVLALGAFALLAATHQLFSQRLADATAPYAEAFRNQVVGPVLRASIRAADIRTDGELDAETIRNGQLYLETFKYVRSCCLLTGQLDGVPYRGSVVRISSMKWSSKSHRNIAHTHFEGALFHLARPVPVTGTVRLVDLPSYMGRRRKYAIRRYARAVHARDTIERIDPEAAMILDEGQVNPPSLPDSVFENWLELRKILGEAFHVSFNASGLYLGVPTSIHRAGILDDRVTRPRQPAELVEDVEQLQRALKALEPLRRMFP